MHALRLGAKLQVQLAGATTCGVENSCVCRGEGIPNVLEQVARARERTLQQYSMRKTQAKQPALQVLPGLLHNSGGRSGDSFSSSVRLWLMLSFNRLHSLRRWL